MREGKEDIKGFLDEMAARYDRPGFIDGDPISIPHLFDRKEDREIAGFLTATISWGQRRTIVENGMRLVQLMDFQPHDFVLQAGEAGIHRLHRFQHRTFNGSDCLYFMHSLRNIYRNHGGLEKAFGGCGELPVKERIQRFRALFFEMPAPARVYKHVADPGAGSAAKRINMFLRWMVRKDGRGVDFGIWDSIPPAQLMCPLDVHSGRVARKLGLLCRQQNDWKAVEELTATLRSFDPDDPVKYDFALFGLGIFEKF